jgi:hypothetical protein
MNGRAIAVKKYVSAIVEGADLYGRVTNFVSAPDVNEQKLCPKYTAR